MMSTDNRMRPFQPRLTEELLVTHTLAWKTNEGQCCLGESSNVLCRLAWHCYSNVHVYPGMLVTLQIIHYGVWTWYISVLNLWNSLPAQLKEIKQNRIIYNRIIYLKNSSMDCWVAFTIILCGDCFSTLLVYWSYLIFYITSIFYI